MWLSKSESEEKRRVSEWTKREKSRKKERQRGKGSREEKKRKLEKEEEKIDCLKNRIQGGRGSE
jgi:hypothetical protein